MHKLVAWKKCVFLELKCLRKRCAMRTRQARVDHLTILFNGDELRRSLGPNDQVQEVIKNKFKIRESFEKWRIILMVNCVKMIKFIR